MTDYNVAKHSKMFSLVSIGDHETTRYWFDCHLNALFSSKISEIPISIILSQNRSIQT